VHHPIAWCCFVVGLFLGLAWGAAECMHAIKHQEGKSVVRIVCNWIGLLCFVAMMLQLIGSACLMWIGGRL
jgi:hypothetical protein